MVELNEEQIKEIKNLLQENLGAYYALCWASYDCKKDKFNSQHYIKTYHTTLRDCIHRVFFAYYDWGFVDEDKVEESFYEFHLFILKDAKYIKERDGKLYSTEIFFRIFKIPTVTKKIKGFKVPVILIKKGCPVLRQITEETVEKVFLSEEIVLI